MVPDLFEGEEAFGTAATRTAPSLCRGKRGQVMQAHREGVEGRLGAPGPVLCAAEHRLAALPPPGRTITGVFRVPARMTALGPGACGAPCRSSFRQQERARFPRCDGDGPIGQDHMNRGFRRIGHAYSQLSVAQSHTDAPVTAVAQ